MLTIDDNVDFLLWEEGEDIKHNSIDKKVLIEDTTNFDNYYDDKNITVDFEIATGDLIFYQNYTWIIQNEIDKNIRTYKARIRKAKHNIKFVIDDSISEFPSIIDTKIMDTQSGQFITLPSGEIKVVLQANEYSKNLKRDIRFIKMGSVFKIVGIDRSKIGLIILHCKEDQFNNVTDDLENEVANIDKLVEYRIEITNQLTELELGKTLQITTNVYKNDEQIELPLVYSVDDTNIATVDANGLLTAQANGTVTITVKLVDKDIQDTLTLEIKEVTQPQYTINIEGGDAISWGDWDYFTIIFKNGGTEYTPSTINYSITDELGNPTDLAYVETFENGECTVYANEESNSGYILLNVDDNEGHNASKQIRIKSMWI